LNDNERGEVTVDRQCDETGAEHKDDGAHLAIKMMKECGNMATQLVPTTATCGLNLCFDAIQRNRGSEGRGGAKHRTWSLKMAKRGRGGEEGARAVHENDDIAAVYAL